MHFIIIKAFSQFARLVIQSLDISTADPYLYEVFPQCYKWQRGDTLLCTGNIEVVLKYQAPHGITCTKNNFYPVKHIIKNTTHEQRH